MIHGGGIHIWNIKLEKLSLLCSTYNGPVLLLTKRQAGSDSSVVDKRQFRSLYRLHLHHQDCDPPAVSQDLRTQSSKKMSLFVAVHVCMWSATIFYFVNVILTIVPCTPRQRAWNPFITGHCININALYQSSGVINAVSDFVILILPMKPIWDLQMPLRRKILMVAVFATGAL